MWVSAVAPRDVLSSADKPKSRPSSKLSWLVPLPLTMFFSLLFGFWAISSELSLITSSLEGADSVERIVRETEEQSAVLAGADDTVSNGATFYPDSLLEEDWSRRVSVDELLHRSELHTGCYKHKENVVLWTYGFAGKNDTVNSQQLINQSDPDLLAKLRICPDIEVFLPGPIRGYGYCEDATAYTYYLKSRILSQWVFEVKFRDESRNRSVTYHDLCPNTPILFLNHYWEGLPDAPGWPAMKPLHLMPNVEMYELDSQYHWRADMILCKTAVCARYLRQWFHQEGNPRGTRVIYTRHTITNIALTIQNDPSNAIAFPAKNFSNVSFLHVVGTSLQKGTRQVLDCWFSRPDFPPLDLYVDAKLYDGAFKDYDAHVNQSQNVRVDTGRLPPEALGRAIAQRRYFLCPSLMEGYGHYINQARSARTFIFTTDVTPMNELVTPLSGAMIPATTSAHGEQFLGGSSPKLHALRNVSGLVAEFTSTALCDVVSAALESTTASEREASAFRALQQYYFDNIFFPHKMQELRDIARKNFFYSRRSRNYLRNTSAVLDGVLTLYRHVST